MKREKVMKEWIDKRKKQVLFFDKWKLVSLTLDVVYFFILTKSWGLYLLVVFVFAQIHQPNRIFDWFIGMQKEKNEETKWIYNCTN